MDLWINEQANSLPPSQVGNSKMRWHGGGASRRHLPQNNMKKRQQICRRRRCGRRPRSLDLSSGALTHRAIAVNELKIPGVISRVAVGVLWSSAISSGRAARTVAFSPKITLTCGEAHHFQRQQEPQPTAAAPSSHPSRVINQMTETTGANLVTNEALH